MKGRKSTKEETERLECASCKKTKPLTRHFYLSNNVLHKTNSNRFPYCKDCLKEIIDINNIQTVQDVLMQMDRPFLFESWNSSVLEVERTKKDLFGVYYKNILLNHKTLRWRDSIFKDVEINNTFPIKDDPEDISDIDDYSNFIVTKEMILRWGKGNYTPEDYMKLEDFYRKMKDTNKIETPQEETYLKKLAVISLKMDKELEEGNYVQVKQLGDLFSKYMTDGKFRAMDRSEADRTGGIRTFGAIFSEVEKDDHIPPWEHYRKIKGLKQDIVDRTIMHIENFTLRLNKIERMAEPPFDTPKLNQEDTNMLDGDSQ